MSLKLVASGDDRARSIRDHLVPLVRDHGAILVQRGSVRVIEYRAGPWILNHWTPFRQLSATEASSPGYRHAIERQHQQSNLPYGLDVWHGEKVLRILWADDGSSEVVAFQRGAWEELALSL